MRGRHNPPVATTGFVGQTGIANLRRFLAVSPTRAQTILALAVQARRGWYWKRAVRFHVFNGVRLVTGQFGHCGRESPPADGGFVPGAELPGTAVAEPAPAPAAANGQRRAPGRHSLTCWQTSLAQAPDVTSLVTTRSKLNLVGGTTG